MSALGEREMFVARRGYETARRLVRQAEADVRAAAAALEGRCWWQSERKLQRAVVEARVARDVAEMQQLAWEHRVIDAEDKIDRTLVALGAASPGRNRTSASGGEV